MDQYPRDNRISALNRLAVSLYPKAITRITRAALVLLQKEHGRTN